MGDPTCGPCLARKGEYVLHATPFARLSILKLSPSAPSLLHTTDHQFVGLSLPPSKMGAAGGYRNDVEVPFVSWLGEQMSCQPPNLPDPSPWILTAMLG